MNILSNKAFAHIFVGAAMAAIIGVGHADDAKTAIGGGLGAAARTAIKEAETTEAILKTGFIRR